MAEIQTPERKKPPAKVRVQAKATRATTAASFVVPEAKAASKVISAKTSAAKETASAGEKAAPEQKKSGTQRAASAAKNAASRRVESAKTSHQKTASAVDSKKRKERVLGLAEMHPKTRMLAAEYMGAIIMAVILLFIPGKSYHEKMSRFFIQMTGISGIFFVLALASSSEKTAKYAIPFGLLIDVSMLAYLFNQHAGDTINSIVGKEPKPTEGGGGGGTARPTAARIDGQYTQGHYADPSQITPGQTINEPEPHSDLGGGLVI